jgi:NDP-sugar pyrophosphorylase family protein
MCYYPLREKTSGARVECSIIMKGCRIESRKRIVDSLIGNYSTVIDSNASIPQGHRLIIDERSFAQL